MSKIFFDHLIHLDELVSVIDQYRLDVDERDELVRLIDEIYHHQILNIILIHLPKSNHEEFIMLITTNPASVSHIDYLKSRVTIDIEEEIKKHSTRIKNELLNEIKKATLPARKSK